MVSYQIIQIDLLKLIALSIWLMVQDLKSLHLILFFFKNAVKIELTYLEN